MVEKGDKGRPVDDEFKIITVLSDNSAVVGLYYYRNAKGFVQADGYVLETNVECKMYLACIQDYPTASMFDGRLFKCKDKFECVGGITLSRADETTFKVPLLKPLKDTK